MKKLAEIRIDKMPCNQLQKNVEIGDLMHASSGAV